VENEINEIKTARICGKLAKRKSGRLVKSKPAENFDEK
jgi:hypothetical protein